MSGFKLLNLNTADPGLLNSIIQDYMLVKDYDTLKRIGLTQNVINELEEGTAFFSYWGAEKDFVHSGRINPARDLDIPGDLYKWYWILPDDPRYSTGAGQGRRVRRLYNSQSSQRQTTGIAGENNDLAVNYINPLLTNFETAPTVNRLLSLWNSYGGDRSVIMTALADFGVGFPNFFTIADGRSDRGQFPELANYPLIPIPPFIGNDQSFYFEFNMQNAYVGTFSGFKYDQMQSIWKEGREPYVAQSIDPETGTYYRGNEVNHDYGVEGKIQIPNYLKGFRGGRNPAGLHYYMRYDLTNLYLRSSLFRSGSVLDGEVGSDGPLGVIPWIEWPGVYDGNTYRPEKSPIGRFEEFGDRDSYIEFIKEVSEHSIAIREWFDAGCPCDWEEWGSYVDPSVKAQQTQQEAVAVSTANKYISAVTSADQPPKKPVLGDLWRDTVSGSTKVFTQINETTRGWVDQ